MPKTMTADEHIRHNEATFERLHKLGVEVRTVSEPWWKRNRDWETESYLDVWVGLYARNLYDNRESIMSGKNIGGIYGILGGKIPVAVVGAGPSLDKNVDSLKDFPGLIVACDRAAKALTARGIRPDLVVVVDPRPHVIAGFIDYPDSVNQVLVACALTNPDVRKTWRGKIVWMGTEHSGTQFFDQVMPAIIPGIPVLLALGNVGNSAVELVHGMGASEIVLVGQDYAYTGGRMHCDDFRVSNGEPSGEKTVYTKIHKEAADFKDDLERRSGKITVDGEVTYEHFKGYRDTLYSRIKGNNMTVINATEGGILNELPKMDLAEYIEAAKIQIADVEEARARLDEATGRKK